MICIILCEGMTPKQQSEVYKKRLENDYETEFAMNEKEDIRVTQRRLRELAEGKDPFDE